MYSMVLLGLGYLAPYNSVLTAVDYFTDKFGSQIEYYVAAALVRFFFKISNVEFISHVFDRYVQMFYFLLFPLHSAFHCQRDHV